jgi:hypothetical protein
MSAPKISARARAYQKVLRSRSHSFFQKYWRLRSRVRFALESASKTKDDVKYF